jgi:signal transduction histidine kinase/DNA-binding response OmpR family regulator
MDVDDVLESELSNADKNSKSGKLLENSMIVERYCGKKRFKSTVKCDMSKISPEITNIIHSTCIHMYSKTMKNDILLENILHKLIQYTDSGLGNITIVEPQEKNLSFGVYDPHSKSGTNNLVCIALGEKIAGTFRSFQHLEGESNPKYHKLTKNLFSRPIRKNRALIVSNYPHISTMPVNHPKITSLLSLPLTYKDDVIGVLCLANRDIGYSKGEPLTQDSKSAKNNGYTKEHVRQIMPLLPLIVQIIKKCPKGKTTLAKTIGKTNDADEVKDRFLAMISHEIRTPLNGILGMTSMLTDAGPLNKKQKEYIKTLTECSLNLTNLLNNILDFSKMAADRLSLAKNPLDVEQTVKDCAGMFEANIKLKGLEFGIYVQKDIPMLVGDSQRLLQILQNLVSNAYKFTSEGYINIRVDASVLEDSHNKSPRIFPIEMKKSILDDDIGNKWKITFTVEDSGVGIKPEEQDKIFNTFHQASTTKTHATNYGTGLGLSIARELTRLMGGRISVKSSYGRGSIFTFFIVLDEHITYSTMNSTYQDILKDKNILVVDDRAVMRLQISEMLFKWGCLPQAVSSAEEALLCLEYSVQGEDSIQKSSQSILTSRSSKFDAVLVDICMPGMSGVELAQELAVKHPNIPLIGISSADVHSGKDYFDYYMNKPIDQHVLFNSLVACLSRRKKTHIKKSKLREWKKLRVLIAEDDKYNVYTLKEMLIYLGVCEKNIEVAENGLECIDKVKRSKKFDIIFMDIKMPKMNGLHATKILKRSYPNILIIAVSAAVQTSEKEKGLRAGIDGYLSKPILREKLRNTLIPLIKK